MRSPKGEMNSGLKKGAWSVEEDHKLISYINRYGIWNWSHMPKFAGLSRSGKSCRLRWMNYLKPDLKKERFSKEEERSILHFHSILGNRWSAIASKLPGRSDNEIKNYWHTHLKKLTLPNNNTVTKIPTQKHMDITSCFKDHNNILEEHVNDDHVINDSTNSLFSWISEDASCSSSSNTNFTTPRGHDVQITDHDIGSPGTVEDLQCFWRQLCPFENLELGNDIQQQMMFDHVFQDLYQDPIISPFSYYNNEYDHAPSII